MIQEWIGLDNTIAVGIGGETTKPTPPADFPKSVEYLRWAFWHFHMPP